MTKIAVIGGSGLENPEILQSPERNMLKHHTASHPLPALRSFGNAEVVILSRHGKDHTIPPSQINNRANIYALKSEGCTHILATTACGSLREEDPEG